MKRTRISALLIALVMVLALFSACGDNNAATTTGSGAATTPAQSTPSTPDDSGLEETDESMYPLVNEATTFTYWGAVDSTVYGYVDNIGELSIFKYMGELTNVYLEAVVLGSDVRGSFSVMVASNDWPDVGARVNRLYTGGLVGAYNDGFIFDLTDYIIEYSPNYYALLQSQDSYMSFANVGTDAILHFAKIWDVWHNIPTGFVIRQDWLDDVGMDVPTTYDELHNVLGAFKTEKGADSPMWLSPYGSGGGYFLTAGFGTSMTMDTAGGLVPFYVVDGEVVCGLTSEGLYEYLELVSGWYDEGLIYPDFVQSTTSMYPAVANYEPAWAKYLSGDMGLAYMSINNIPDAEAAGLSITPMPDVTKNAGDTLGIIDLSPSADSAWVITGGCDEDLIPIICQYIDYFFTNEGSVLISYGVQGEAWDYDANGNIAYTDLMLNNPDELSWMTLLTLYTSDVCPGYSMDSRSTDVYSDTQKAALDIWLSNQTGEYAYLDAVTMTADELAEYTNIFTEVQTFAMEWTLSFITGQRNLEAEWDKYISTLETLNVARVTEIRQDAYDRYVNKYLR